MKIKHHAIEDKRPELGVNDHVPHLHSMPAFAATSNDQFLHELRNPLMNIELCVAILKGSVNVTDTEKYLNIISHSTNIIKNILNNKSPGNNNVNCSLNKMLDDALEMTQDRVTLRNIEIQKHYSKQIGNLILDEAGIKIVFTNIIINAVEAIHSKNGKLNITTKPDNDKYVVIIEDNGIGINEKNLEKLFDAYYTNKPNGMGLGLATAQAMLKINHASVKVESVENEGTRFIMIFDQMRG